ncbi:hypothetical protein [Streptomyces sp. MJP52]|uniref:hypothetical protein n=1 Tax=Streptomyces sp. MJP52 TaxID=2940555 RepID=UPI002475D6C1|nr:hypothetical protein [Streptomyces sp. MJP52]MDH6224318.1 hypothetical protein [Streptomyces sp. MJP52]
MIPFRLKPATPTPADLAPPRCTNADPAHGQCVLPSTHTGDCLHAGQPRCDAPSPSGLYACRLAEWHDGPHANSPSPGPVARAVWESPAEPKPLKPAKAPKPADGLVPHAVIEVGWTRGPLDARLRLEVQPGMDEVERRHLEDRIRDALTAAGLPVRRG